MSSPDYDPDSAEPQPHGSLGALIGRILAEMERLQFRSFSKDDALDLGLLLVELGRRRSHPIAIDITKGEQVLFHAALEGATPATERWIRAKQRTAVRYEVPSLLVGLRARAAGGRIEDNTVTVSGLPQKADHELVVEALTEILGRTAGP